MRSSSSTQEVTSWLQKSLLNSRLKKFRSHIGSSSIKKFRSDMYFFFMSGSFLNYEFILSYATLNKLLKQTKYVVTKLHIIQHIFSSFCCFDLHRYCQAPLPRTTTMHLDQKMNEFPLIHRVIPFEQETLSLGDAPALEIINEGNLIKSWTAAKTFTFVAPLVVENHSIPLAETL